MVVELVRGDIQVSRRQTIVLPISADGVVVSPCHAPLLRRYPLMARKMQELCREGLLPVGKLWIYRHSTGRYVLVFPVKERAEEDASAKDIEAGLRKLAGNIEARGIESLAVPLLSSSDGDLLSIEESILGTIDVPIDIYTEEVPLTISLPPLLEKLCGKLSEEKLNEINQKLCFSSD